MAGTNAQAGAQAAQNEALNNATLHPPQKTWIAQNAAAFATYYEQQTGKTITVAEAQQMLLGTGYIINDATAASGPGYNAVAGNFIASSPTGSALFSPTAAERSNPGQLVTASGALTPEQAALPGSTANPMLGLGLTAGLTGGLGIAAYGPELLAGISDAFAAYKAAQAGYSLTTAAMTGAAVSGGSYTAAAAANATYNYFNTGQSFTSSFEQKFSLAGLAAASTVGAYNSMFGTSMFSWAGIPNSIANITTVPGLVIRLNGIALGQVAGKAAQAAVNQSK
ncbi:hypothetical protein M0D69_22525 [Caballeronia sp. SEWSISQ10-4 2]|nr:hypothetical protein [Caballeronia sp. SEWSISQ10-4 2]MDN7180722.1 hypothetical protein [Caballeronia sp. SEWSISQ10-4 2]